MDGDDRIGVIGQNEFFSLCERARLYASRPEPDRTGKDFIVEWKPDATQGFETRPPPRGPVAYHDRDGSSPGVLSGAWNGHDTGFRGGRSIFRLVALAGIATAFHYLTGAGETLPQDRRRTARPSAIAGTYAGLAADERFIFPALAVGLVIGCLYSFFGAAPAILMNQMGFSATELSVFFAATVLVVFGSGLLTSRLARRWGAPRVGMTGIVIAASGGLWLLLQAGSTTPAPFMAAVTLFLAGMGLINPIATSIALQPFGDRAGVASALLGFLQIMFAALGTALIGALPAGPGAAFAWVVFGGTALAAAAFFPVLRNR